jgi:hypothetical protein
MYRLAYVEGSADELLHVVRNKRLGRSLILQIILLPSGKFVMFYFNPLWDKRDD